MRGFVTREIGDVTGDGVDRVHTDDGEAHRPDLLCDTEPIEACHRGGSEGDPTLVIRKLGGGFVDLDSTADLGKRECSTRTSDSTPNH